MVGLNRWSEDFLNLELRTNVFLGSREMGEKILRFIIEYDDVLTPETFDGGLLTGNKKVKFDPEDLSLALRAWADGRHALGIVAERQRPVQTSLNVMSSDFRMFDFLSIGVNLKWFVDQKRVRKFLDISGELYNLLQANSGYVQNWRHEPVVGETVDENGVRVKYEPPIEHWSLRGLFWANFFGPEYVDMWGREKLLGAPCYKVEPLSDGGILLLLTESPLDASKSEYKAKKQELYSYLGQDAFTGSLLPRFRVGPGRKVKDARPLIETGGARDDVFWHGTLPD